MDFDATGKVALDAIYAQPDPRAYFNTLREFDYCIPQLAKPYFAKFVQEYRESTGVVVPTVLDIGCSYGINAALLRCEATMDEFYEHYGSSAPQDREELLARDRDLLRSRGQFEIARFVGLDSSEPALAYALSAGFLDAAVHADLEAHEPTPRQREQLRGADLVVSTGCIGYVGERTLTRVVEAQDGRLPWMAHFVLRMFPFEPMAERLSRLGYETVVVDGVFRQRRFVSAQEQAQVLDTLSAVGVDPSGLEADGWLHARLHLSRPVGTRPVQPH
ncbi:class I SAM-dependent methyltransferase [Saccharopolyspora taberi]|uniref:Class I SAM-dependent methyltransferase n=1 Tax=Saccharopolyspora taberi TaxID=60895 RepID=A0ABN3VEA9_9PSEU